MKLQITLILVTFVVTLFLIGCTPQTSTRTVTNEPAAQPVGQGTNEQPSQATNHGAPPQATTQVPPSQGNPSNPGPGGRYRNGNRTGTGFSSVQMNQAEQAACDGKSENEACTISLGNRTISGTCRSLNNTLVCRFQRTGNFTRPSAIRTS